MMAAYFGDNWWYRIWRDPYTGRKRQPLVWLRWQWNRWRWRGWQEAQRPDVLAYQEAVVRGLHFRRTWRIVNRPTVTVRFQWEPRDIWIGVFWRRTRPVGHAGSLLHLYICVCPCVPLHLTMLRPARTNRTLERRT